VIEIGLTFFRSFRNKFSLWPKKINPRRRSMWLWIEQLLWWFFDQHSSGREVTTRGKLRASTTETLQDSPFTCIAESRSPRFGGAFRAGLALRRRELLWRRRVAEPFPTTAPELKIAKSTLDSRVDKTLGCRIEVSHNWDCHVTNGNSFPESLTSGSRSNRWRLK